MTLKTELVMRCDSLGCTSAFTTGADMSGMGRFLDAAFASGWTDPEACQYCPGCSAPSPEQVIQRGIRDGFIDEEKLEAIDLKVEVTL